MRVLVTGGAGFVGRHLTHALLERGDEVVSVDSLAPRTGGIHPKSLWPMFDPRDFRSFHFQNVDCRAWFTSNPNEYFDQVHHLAALVGGREVIENDPLAVAEDLAIDSLFWRWAKTARPGWIGCYSSSAAYPIRLQREGSYRLLTEADINLDEDIGRPDLTYGWAKLTCEYLAQIAFAKHELASCIFRPFSGYGEDQDLAYPFPSIVKRVIESRHEKSLSVWGSGRQMRDFIHISDCVRLILIAAEKISNATAINISTGVMTSFIDLAKGVARCAEAEMEVRGMIGKPEGVFARGGDTTRQREIGFVPEITLEEGISRAVKHLGAKSK